MLTEDDARALLARAADTIEVNPGEPAVLPRRRPGLLVAGAVSAVAAALVVVATVVALLPTNETDPAAPSPPPTTAPAVDTGQVPPVLGLDVEDAREALESRGLQVVVREHPTCAPAGVALSTTPPAGEPIAGQKTPIHLRVSSSAGLVECPSDDADDLRPWQLLRFALGVAGPPTLAAEVDLFAGPGLHTTLSATEAADPGNWQLCDEEECYSALVALETAAQQPGTPSLTWQSSAAGSPEGFCAPPPEPLAGRRSLTVTIQVPTDGMFLCLPPRIGVYFDAEGAIDAVVLPPPVRDEQPEEPPANASAAGEALVDFALGGDPPAFADEVLLLLGDDVRATLGPDEAADPEAWELCSSSPIARCDPRSALRVIAGEDSRVVLSGPPPGGCLVRTGELPPGLDESQSVRLSQPEPRGCRDDWAVEVWADDDGRIAAVNLLLGS